MELVIGNNQYSSTGKLDAFSQLHVARKLGPAIPIVEGLVAKANASKDKGLLTVLMLSHISDEDTEYVIHKCLKVVVRKQEGGMLSKIQSIDGQLMFDDIGMSELLELTVAIIEENLGDFFRAAIGAMETEMAK